MIVLQLYRTSRVWVQRVCSSRDTIPEPRAHDIRVGDCPVFFALTGLGFSNLDRHNVYLDHVLPTIGQFPQGELHLRL